jgi:hypothetical protein
MERTTITVAKLPSANLVAALAAVELDTGATVDEAEEADEAAVLAAAVLVEAKGVEEVMVSMLEDPASGVLTGTELAGAEMEEDVPTGEEPEGAGVLAGTGVDTGATEATEDDEAAAQVESAVSLTLTHWVTESLLVV